MADRSILVTLRANTTDFQLEMGKAASSLDTLVKRSGDASGAADTTLGRIAQSAHLQRAAWTTVGTAVAGVGAAWTGVNVLIGKTGTSYNTLQQSSRAALETMLGGAAEANRQMEKLDKFALTSPFSKQVFLQAQQQMIGFGIETEKVIGYLEAINDAVAATGGGNEQIAELSLLFSQISASAKITGVDLRRFGNHGIDAATYIGNAMGKTGTQIREEITSGTIDAKAALDALAQGMGERFEGASAGIKDTMTGAIDRVKAAWRDLSADMSSGLVSPDGGGMLVSATNALADLLRLAGKLPDPLKRTAFHLSGVGGATATLYGAALLAVPKLVEYNRAVAELSKTSPRLTGALGNLGKAAGVAAIALTTLTVLDSISRAFQEAIPEADRFATALERVSGAQNDLAAERAMGRLFDKQGIEMAMEEALNWQRWWDSNNWYLNPTNRVSGEYASRENSAERFDILDTQLSLADPKVAADNFVYLMEVADNTGRSIEDLISLLPLYRDSVVDAAEANGLMNLSQEQLVTLMSGGAVAVQDFVGGPWRSFSLTTEEIAEIVEDSGVAFERMFNAFDVGSGVMALTAEGADVFAEAIEGGADASEAFDAALEAMGVTMLELDGRVQILTEAQASFAEAVIAASTGMVDVGNAYATIMAENDALAGNYAKTADAIIEELRKQAEAHEEFLSNQIDLLGRVDADFLQHIIEQGPEVTAVFARMDADQIAEATELWRRGGRDKVEAHASGMLEWAPVVEAAARYIGEDAAEEVKAALVSGMDVQDVIDKWDLNLVLDLEANAEPAMLTTDEFMAQVEADKATVDIEADTDPAMSTTEEFMAATESEWATVTVEGDATPAWQEVADWKRDTDDTTATAKVDANTDPAIRAAEAAMARIRAMSTRIGVTADIRQNITRRVMGQAMEADGGVLDFYANGGFYENRVAQLAPQGTTRVFNEPETLGEAYIPLAESKRTRSLEIWAETGKRLGVDGFEDGAVVTHARAAQPVPFTPSPSVNPSTHPVPSAGLSDTDIARLAAALREGAYSGTQTGIAERQAGLRIDNYRGRY